MYTEYRNTESSVYYGRQETRIKETRLYLVFDNYSISIAEAMRTLSNAQLITHAQRTKAKTDQRRLALVQPHIEYLNNRL